MYGEIIEGRFLLGFLGDKSNCCSSIMSSTGVTNSGLVLGWMGDKIPCLSGELMNFFGGLLLLVCGLLLLVGVAAAVVIQGLGVTWTRRGLFLTALSTVIWPCKKEKQTGALDLASAHGASKT
jgi:hypothetical protein